MDYDTILMHLKAGAKVYAKDPTSVFSIHYRISNGKVVSRLKGSKQYVGNWRPVVQGLQYQKVTADYDHLNKAFIDEFLKSK